MGLQIRYGTAEVGDGVQDANVGGGNLAFVLCQPGEEVEKAFEDGHRGGGRAVRKGAGRVDGRDAALRRASESGRGLEGEAADVVGKADVVVGLAEGLATEDDLLAVAGGDCFGDPSRGDILQQVRRPEVPDHEDAARQRVRLPGLADPRGAAGPVSGVAYDTACSGLRQSKDILRGLARRAAPALHHEVDVPAACSGAVVVPDVPVRVDVERGVLVLAEG